MLVASDKFEKIMDYEFHNAGGQRKNCGFAPSKFRNPIRYGGKGGKTRFNQDWADYRACVNAVRQMNIAQGLPADTGIPTDVPQKEPSTSPLPPSPDMGTGFPTWGYYAIGGGALILGYFAYKAIKKGGVHAMPNPALGGK